CYLVAITLAIPTSGSLGQTVNVGAGSYSMSLPSGAVGPQNSSGENISPKVSSSFSLPVQSNDFWSSLIFPFFGDQHSSVLYAHPLNVKAVSSGLQVGYTSEHVFVANDYLYPFAHQLTVGVSGLSTSRTTAHHYGDWTATALWDDGSVSMEATFGHGLPYVFFRISGGNAIVTLSEAPTIWHNQDGVLGITVAGKHYGIFAPTGSTWSGTTTLQSSLDGKDFLSVALLPDASASTLDLFKRHAYAFVINSIVDWQYDEAAAELTTTYSYETTWMDDPANSTNETLTALYRHQWLNTSAPLTGHSYQSPRGVMKLYEGSSFTTNLMFSGVLPALPDRGDYNRSELLSKVQSVAAETLPIGPTYENGKAMARFANLVHIADQLGATAERDYFLSELKRRLEEWFTVGGAGQYAYIDEWDVLTGYPSGFGADREINDHHFHSAYAIVSAATVARYDSAWASQENWGGMVNLLIKDANNWDRSETRFPFLRSHDAYAGHSWAAGHAAFGDGNNQESSSESMNFATAAILWGEATNQTEIRDLGVFLHATESSAVHQYWFDVDDQVFPEGYPHVAIGMVWGAKGVHATWFGAEPEFIHGINILPVTAGSLYLGHHPEYVIANYDEIVAERSGQPNIWKDVLWEYLALADPNRALSYYFADENYTPFDGESRAHTLHWLYNLKKMGRPDTTVFADIATYAVFRTTSGDVTYVAYNAGSQERLVTYSDGFTMMVGPRELASFSTAEENPDAPVVLLRANKTSGKLPLTVDFEGGRSFDRSGGSLTFEWDFGPAGTSAAPDTTVTFETIGDHWVFLTVTNEAALTAKDSVMISVLGNGTPFNGSPARVPGRIEAEDYDNGGEGTAYHDSDANNIGLAYRPNEGVDLEGANDGGFDVYWITDGEWIEYTIEAPETGLYDFAPYVATVPGFGNLTLLIDGEDVSGRRAVRSTGGWQFWTPINIDNVRLEAGVHIMRLEADSESDKTGWLFSVNYIDVRRSTQVGVEDAQLPDDFSLSQNYPNPFNPASMIRYALPVASHLKLEVFNALGQMVLELTNDRMEAGHHSVVFDGSGLPSGLYLYRMTASTFSQTRKMLLLK
ncbi:MAG: carbohydrate-binding protein, partial [Rhodothermia bacterium]|nr:carbohydrate-binding protein [Rhodothermia bacterium]